MVAGVDVATGPLDNRGNPSRSSRRQGSRKCATSRYLARDDGRPRAVPPIAAITGTITTPPLDPPGRPPPPPPHAPGQRRVGGGRRRQRTGRTLPVIFARRQDGWREEDGPASSCGRGRRGRVAEGTACLRERGQPPPGGLPPVGRGRLPPRSTRIPLLPAGFWQLALHVSSRFAR